MDFVFRHGLDDKVKDVAKMSLRIKCLTCGLCVNRIARHTVLELDTRVVSFIAERISPQIITEHDIICQACFDATMKRVNEIIHTELSSNDNQHPGSSQHAKVVGHSNVCLMFGCSILRRKSDLIFRNNPSELQQMIATIIMNSIETQQTTTNARVCHSCWMKSRRTAMNIMQAEQNEATPVSLPSTNVIEPSELIIEEPPSATEQSELMIEEQPISSATEQSEIPDIPEQGSEEIGNVTLNPSGSTSSLSEWVPEIPSVITQSEPAQIASITLQNYRRAPNTAAQCLFLYCNNRELHRISDELRIKIIMDYNFYIPVHARACSDHLISNNWDTSYNSENSSAVFTVDQVEHMFSFINLNRNTLIDFNDPLNIDDHLFQYWLGLTKEKFNNLLDEVPQIQAMHKGVIGLVAFLIKLRNGDSDERIASLMGIPRRSLERWMNNVREKLIQYFVPNNLGIEQISRQNILNHNLLIPNGIYNSGGVTDHPIVICDGTYIYAHKSANYRFQKESYSLHKYRNLLKPFMLVLCDGYILDCFGPFKATDSDAEIMTSLFSDENMPLRQYFRENDIFILDRGFRDCISLLENLNYKPYMPESVSEGERQLTTAQANRTRCVTLCRWVVEVINGHFKRDFKLFRQEFFHKSLPHMMQDFQIAAALLNRFGVRLKNRDNAPQILNRINQRMHLHNNLADVVENNHLNRRSSNFINITADNNLLYFPRLQYEDLILFALRTYQLRQARSYFGEHTRFHGQYRIEVCTEIPDSLDLLDLGVNVNEVSIIRGRIKSRHIGRKQYYVYILINNGTSGLAGIREYCCNCIVGRRTLGCCAHIMTIVWYLGWARHEPNVAAPAAFLDDVFIREL